MNPLLQALPLQAYLEELHQRLAGVADGELASYIPELSRADPNWFGIALVTVDGHVYQVGDSHQPFTIQSISKAITFGLALEDRGVETVLAKVGVEPSGEAFNSISLEKDTGRPFNPMINAGAIATTGLIKGEAQADKLARILARFERFVGHPVTMDDEVYASERDTGHRNRAIVHPFHAGEAGESLYFLTQGVVDLVVRTHGGHERRVVSMCAGMSFGEFVMVTGDARSLDARAVTEVVCRELPFARIGADIRSKLLSNLARELSRRLNVEARQLQILG